MVLDESQIHKFADQFTRMLLDMMNISNDPQVNTLKADMDYKISELEKKIESVSKMPGPPGIKGESGLNGMKGDTGADGIRGMKGDTGADGISGMKGDTGADGIRGMKGDMGIDGIKGLRGEPGTEGVKGMKGEPGIEANVTEITSTILQVMYKSMENIRNTIHFTPHPNTPTDDQINVMVNNIVNGMVNDADKGIKGIGSNDGSVTLHELLQ